MNRKIPKEIIVQTLFGPDIAVKKCNFCNEEKYLHQFYCESESKKSKFQTIEGQVRNQCIDCWSSFQGRTYPLQYR